MRDLTNSYVFLRSSFLDVRKCPSKVSADGSLREFGFKMDGWMEGSLVENYAVNMYFT